jgi:S-DNA-T family DNA segregation ATPase FtsK/SpoIIIE
MRLSVYLKEVFTQEVPKFRLIAITAGGILGFISTILGVSITGALFGAEGFLFGVGTFLVNAYGVLSFAIPAYIFFAAFILAEPVYRPQHIFILNAILVPFMTLAIGFVFIRDFDNFSRSIPLLRSLGRSGFNFFIVLLTTAEGIAITLFMSMLFPREYEKREYIRHLGQDDPLSSRKKVAPIQRPSAWRMPRSPLHLGKPPPILLLPFSQPEPQPLEEAPEETPLETPPPTPVVKEFRLPELKPLSTAQVIEEFTAVRETQEPVAPPAAPKPKPVEKVWPPYQVPVSGVLNERPDTNDLVDTNAEHEGRILEETLREFNIQAKVTDIRKGPAITMFEILPAPGVKLTKIASLQDNFALRLAAVSVRVVAPIPGKPAVGIEVPNAKRSVVAFAELIEAELGRNKCQAEVPVILGKDINGESQTIDLTQTPHILIAGSTGSGKSVCVNTMILSILYLCTPTQCKLILIDPKIVELKLYNGIPHLLTPVITEPAKAFQALQYCISEMEQRYANLEAMSVRDIKTYNRRVIERKAGTEPMPYIVVIIDEFADLMATSGKELEAIVARLTAMSRAVGIHLVLATQRPSVDVITGLIKSNIPSRIAFMVASNMDSRIILDKTGAEKLLGKGDMLYKGADIPFPVRIQGAFVSDEEIERVVEHVKTLGEPAYVDNEMFYNEGDAGSLPYSGWEDPLYGQALQIVKKQGKLSASSLQHKLNIKYNRAARLVKEMEERGVLGSTRGSKSRESLKEV